MKNRWVFGIVLFFLFVCICNTVLKAKNIMLNDYLFFVQLNFIHKINLYRVYIL